MVIVSSLLPSLVDLLGAAVTGSVLVVVVPFEADDTEVVGFLVWFSDTLSGTVVAGILVEMVGVLILGFGSAFR